MSICSKILSWSNLYKKNNDVSQHRDYYLDIETEKCSDIGFFFQNKKILTSDFLYKKKRLYFSTCIEQKKNFKNTKHDNRPWYY